MYIGQRVERGMNIALPGLYSPWRLCRRCSLELLVCRMSILLGRHRHRRSRSGRSRLLGWSFCFGGGEEQSEAVVVKDFLDRKGGGCGGGLAWVEEVRGSCCDFDKALESLDV